MVKLASVQATCAPNTKPLSKEEALEALRSRGSAITTLQSSIILLLGPPKHGKTFCAASISEQYPESLPADELHFLSDTYWLLFDNAGLDGFAEQGLEVPHSDLSRRPKDLLDFKKALRDAIAEIKDYVAAGVVKNIVVDTISSFDEIIMAYLEKKYAGGNDKPWGELRQIHSDFLQELRSIGVRIIVIGHVKEYVDWVQKGEEMKADAKRHAASLPGASDVVLSVTGAAARMYRAQASIIASVVKTKPAKKDAIYNLYLDSNKGVEGGSRFTKGLDAKQPAHLGKLLQTIKKNQPKEKQ